MCVNQSRPPFDTIQFLDACQYLVRRGADIDAVDDQGISVSVEAYAPNRGLRRKECMNSLGGDVWDRVLAGAGFDVAYFRTRHGIRRRARYHGQYSRRNFEAMWAGMTELCPYYHDVELPYHRFYSAKSLFGFRSLWRQWGEDVVVGSLEEIPWCGSWICRATYDDQYGTENEDWSRVLEDDFDYTSNEESEWQAVVDEDSDQDGDRESNIYEASDKGSHHARGQDSVRDSDRENDGDDDRDIDDDSDDGDSDDGGCRL